MLKPETVCEYQGYSIDINVYGKNEYSINIDGDDCVFPTLKSAMDYIDKIA